MSHQKVRRYIKGGDMGPLLVLVSHCLRENVVVACNIGSFLCTLNNFTSEKRNCFLFSREKLQKFLQLIFHLQTYIYFPNPIDVFCLTKKYEFIRYGFSFA